MRFLKRPEIQLPLYFVLLSVSWIILSDIFLLNVQSYINSFQLTRIQTIKGCCYVVIVALLIHVIIKSANRKLVKSEEEYKDLFYNAPNPMLAYDKESKKFFNVNKAAVEAYGYTTDEFTKMSIDDVRVKDPQHDPLKVRTCNLRKHKKKNSEYIICQETTREVFIKDEPACLLSAIDVTEHEKAKAELLNREKQLRQILNSITDGFFILNSDLSIDKANELFKDIVEVPVEQVEGKKLSELFPSLRNSEAFNKYLEALEKHASVHFETYYEHKSIWLRISAYPYDHGLSVFFRDITKEKEDEFHHYQNQQNLLALINNTEDHIWSIDNQYRYFTYNQAYESAYKRLFHEDLWIGKTALNEQAGADHVRKWKGLYDRALSGEKFFTDMEFVIDNRSHFATIRFNPFYNASNKVIGVGCFLQNITERKLYERKIEQQNDKLKQIAFLTSHKVRVPLANILGLTEILDKDDPLSASNAEIIEHLKTSAKQLDQTIHNMVQQTSQFD